METTSFVAESFLSGAQLLEVFRRFRTRVFFQLDHDASETLERAVVGQFQVEIHLRVVLSFMCVYVKMETEREREREERV